MDILCFRIKDCVVDHVDPLSVLSDTSRIYNPETQLLYLKLVMSVSDQEMIMYLNGRVWINNASVNCMCAMKIPETNGFREGCNKIFAGKRINGTMVEISHKRQFTLYAFGSDEKSFVVAFENGNIWQLVNNFQTFVIPWTIVNDIAQTNKCVNDIACCTEECLQRNKICMDITEYGCFHGYSYRLKLPGIYANLLGDSMENNPMSFALCQSKLPGIQ